MPGIRGSRFDDTLYEFIFLTLKDDSIVLVIFYTGPKQRKIELMSVTQVQLHVTDFIMEKLPPN